MMTPMTPMTRFILVAVLAAAAGCGRTLDCNQGTIFLSVTLDDRAAQATTLAVSVVVEGAAPLAATTAHQAGATHGGLEIKFPDRYPGGKSATITVDARDDAGAILGSRTSPAAPLGTGCTALALEVAGNGGGGGNDGGSDGGGGGGFEASTDKLAFVTTVRGMAQPATQTVHFTNRGTSAAAPGLPVIAGATRDAFSLVAAATTCGSDAVAAAASCDVGIAFTPVVSGANAAHVDVAGAHVQLTGDGTPTWTRELSGQNIAWSSVWGSGPNDVWVSGAGRAFRSNGRGDWVEQSSGLGSLGSFVCGSSTSDVQVITGYSRAAWSGTSWATNSAVGDNMFTASDVTCVAGRIFVAGYTARNRMGTINYVDGPGGVYKEFQTGTGFSVNGIYAVDANTALAVGGNGSAWLYMGGAWADATAVISPKLPAIRLTSGWGASLAEGWLVGADNYIGHIKGTALTADKTQPAFNGATLKRIVGRANAKKEVIELYAIGSIPDFIYHSTGKDDWEALAAPFPTAPSGLWLSATGEVYAVGSGFIAHYY